MLGIILKSFFSLILITGCGSSADYFKTSFDREYKVIDGGNINVIIKSRACSFSIEKAILGAKSNAEFHLRSVVGDKKHRKEFKEVSRYNNGKKVCVEMSALALPPF